jgi:hypothetical protein
LPDTAEIAHESPVYLIERRIKNLSQWLEKNAAECTSDQAHLNEGSIERAYWHWLLLKQGPSLN